MDPGVGGATTRRRGSLLLRAVLVVAAAALLPACGNVTSGGAGEVELLLTSDEWELGASLGALEDPSTRAQVVVDDAELAGTLTASVRSYVRTGTSGGDSDWLEITDGVQEIVVPLGDPSPVPVARATLQAGEYRAVRTLFGRVRVEVERGLTVGGEPFTGEIQVAFGEGGLLVVEERNLRIERDLSVPLLLEMGARRWIQMVDRDTRAVSEEDFEREFRTRTASAR